MYSAKQYLSGFTLLFGAVISTWMVLKLTPSSSPAVKPPDANFSYMTDVTITRMNVDTGKPQDQLQTPVMVHSALNGKTTMDHPHFIIFQPIGEPWQLSGDHGQTNNSIDILDLWGNIVLTQPPSSQNETMTITTSAVTIYPKQKYADTKQPVVGIQPGSTLQAIGMHADFKTGMIYLLSNVHGKSQN